MYLCLTALIQLNLLATRNPSFWWRFSKKTAPRWAPAYLAQPLTSQTMGSPQLSRWLSAHGSQQSWHWCCGCAGSLCPE